MNDKLNKLLQKMEEGSQKSTKVDNIVSDVKGLLNDSDTNKEDKDKVTPNT